MGVALIWRYLFVLSEPYSGFNYCEAQDGFNSKIKKGKENNWAIIVVAK
jgi:hypothetical protein